MVALIIEIFPGMIYIFFIPNFCGLPSLFSFLSQSDSFSFPFRNFLGFSNLYFSPFSNSIIVFKKHQAFLLLCSTTTFEMPLLKAVVLQLSPRLVNTSVAPLSKSSLVVSSPIVLQVSPLEPKRLEYKEHMKIQAILGDICKGTYSHHIYWNCLDLNSVFIKRILYKSELTSHFPLTWDIYQHLFRTSFLLFWL